MLGVRLDPATERELADVARRLHRSKSDIAREAIAKFVRAKNLALAQEARRQSENAVRRGRSEEDAHWESIAASWDLDGAPAEPDA
jgi:predicted transcriptional regulator